MSYQFLAKRFSYLIIILFAASCVSFLLCSNTYSDPIETWCTSQYSDKNNDECRNSLVARNKIKAWRLDLPPFYFQLAASSEPDTFYRISDKYLQKTAVALLAKNGNWQAVQSYFQAIQSLKNSEANLKDTFPEPYYSQWNEAKDRTRLLIYLTAHEDIQQSIDSLKQIFRSHPAFQPFLSQLLNVQAFYSLIQKDTQLQYKNFVPTLHFYGSNNQYHQWLLHFLQGDWGKSYRTDEPVKDRILSHLGVSVLFGGLSFLIIYLFGLGLGILKAFYKGRFIDVFTTQIAFLLNAIPNFMLGIFLLFLFANPLIFNWFLSQYHFSGAWWERATLPLIAYSLSGVISVSQVMAAKIGTVLGEDYIQTARAKGLSEMKVILVHALKNALLPLITMAASTFPHLVGGSLVLETLFGIEGMGYECFQAISQLDIPMILAVQFLTTFLTVISFACADLLSTQVDKRIYL